MVRLSLTELRYISDLVAQATVIDNSVERMPGRETLQTVVQLRLDRVLVGEELENDIVVVREWGGEKDGEVTTLPSAPIYSPGERVLVFLERDPKDVGFRTVGLSQGKYTLVEERDTGRDTLVKLQLPRPVSVFDERQVKLSAFRLYADDVWKELEREIQSAVIPAYSPIPGLPLHKDEAFLDAAVRAGQPVKAALRERILLRRAEVGLFGGAR